MADDVQALLNRINEQGLKKAEAERDSIVEKARSEAEQIIKEAQEKAAKITADAESEANLTLQKGKESLQQASRDVLLSLKEQLAQRMGAVAKECTTEAVASIELADVIAKVMEAYAASGAKVDDVKVLLKPDAVATLEKALMGGLGKDLAAKTTISPMPSISNGFELVFNGQDVSYQFTDEALTETLVTFLNPKLASLILDDK